MHHTTNRTKAPAADVVLVKRDELRDRGLALAIGELRAGGTPLPLRRTSGTATAQALALRTAGLNYRAIALVMSTYHGIDISPHAWGRRCQSAGAPKYARRGRPFGSR
jgi:hypothetical protein